ncbi:MAG: hypothetical protein ACI959_002120 [Limisphaerales bacterium]|jgi:hypothetical protein
MSKLTSTLTSNRVFWAIRSKYVIGLTICGLLLAGLSTCEKPPEYPLEPIITFESLSSNSITEFSNDSLSMTFSFTDGDGDLGYDGEGGGEPNIFVEDIRVLGSPITYRMDSLGIRSNVPAISGTIKIVFSNGFFACLEDVDIETTRFTVQIVDRAGNYSNIIETPDINIDCQ